MQSATDMTLPFLPVELPEFAVDPMPFIYVARSQHPWLARFDAGYIVHGYQAAKDLISMDDRLQPGFGGIVEYYDAQGTPWGRFMEEIVIARSGPDHSRLRGSVTAAFTPRKANQDRPLMRRVISDLLDEWAPKAEFDFALFASYFPVSVICGLLGVSAEPIPRIRTALENQIASVSLNRALKPIFLASYDVIWNFVDGLIVEREKCCHAGSESLLDTLIATKDAGQMDETELRFMVMTLLLAGYDTSKNMLTKTMQMMLRYPEKWDQCANDKEFCGKVVEEMLRHSSISTPFRIVAEDFVYDDVLFPKGAMVLLALPLAGRDPAAFADPMKFDPDRVSVNRHLAFGRGAHMCLGQFIARNQLQEGLHLIAQRITKPRLLREPTCQQYLGVWSLQTLPISFEPGEFRAPE